MRGMRNVVAHEYFGVDLKIHRGERVALRTITHVREDALDLFGFATEEEEDVFILDTPVEDTDEDEEDDVLEDEEENVFEDDEV